MVHERVGEIIEKYGGHKDGLIMIMQDIQDEYRYLPEDALNYLSERMDIPMTQIYAVATFYKAFSLEPKGEKTICVCTGTACHVRGADRILDRLERELHVKPGGTTLDKKYTLETVRCVGACSLAPIVILDKDTHGRLDQDKAVKLIKK